MHISWIKDNKMVCSGDKSKLLVIWKTKLKKKRLNQELIKIDVCGKTIIESRSEKLLGLVVNNELTFKEYLYGEKWRTEDNFIGLLPKLSKRIGLLKQLYSEKMSKENFNMIAQGIFTSTVIYCI